MYCHVKYKKKQFEDYKNEIGRGHEDLALYFKLSLKNIVKQIKAMLDK